MTALAVLAASLLLTGALTAFFWVTAQSRDSSRFEGQVQMTQDRITAQLDSDITLLRGAAGFFAASETVTPQKFRIYTERLQLERHGVGIQGLGFSRRFPESQQPEHHAVTYLEPLDAHNQAALGFDMFTEPPRREAMERAWLSGEPALSGKVLLQQESEENTQPGFLLFVPVYQGGAVPATQEERRQKLDGFVYSCFQAASLFNGMFPPAHQPRVFFRIYDGAQARPEQLLYDSAEGEEVPASHSSLVRTSSWELAGRTWTAVFVPRPLFEMSMLTPWVPVAGSLGLLLSLMTFAIAWTQTRARQRAEASEAERARLLARERTAHAEAETRRIYLQTITDALPALVAYVDADECYRFANRAYESWFGLKPEAVVGKKVVELIGVEAYERFKGVVQKALAGEVVRNEGELPVSQGHQVSIQSVYVPDRDEQGRVRGFVALALDITERKKAEEATREAVRLRDEFLSVASHELKTPLTPLSLKLQMLARAAASQPETPFVLRVREDVAAGRRQIHRLSELIGDLLDVARISSGKMKLHWEEVDFATVAREVAARLESEAIRAECRLAVEAPAVLTGRSDRLRFEQVVENLLTNAIKYGAGKPIHLLLEKRPLGIRLTVKDLGIGIPQMHQARIFERFERAVSERNYGGLGLGLYITRTIVEALSGTIRVESQPDQGACFTVELPSEPPAP